MKALYPGLTIVLRVVDLTEAGIEPRRNQAVVDDQVALLRIDVLSIADVKDLTTA